jgi:hypothetical protein
VQQADFERFKSIMSGMARMYGANLDTVLLDAYWLALDDWPLADFEAAAKQLMKTATFMPKPAEFNALRKAYDMTAGEAFALARRIAQRLNPRELISHRSGEEKLDAAVRACGGFEAIAMCETAKIGFLERRFVEHYETISDAHETRAALPELAENSPWRLAGPRRLLS